MKARVLALPVLLSLLAGVAHAEPPSWRARYEAARERIGRGECKIATPEFDELARTAATEADRQLAEEMGRVCREIDRPKPPTAASSRLRGQDEMTLLYANAFIYGLGTSAWFVLETQPSQVLEAMLPFAAFTIGSVGAVALVDHYAPFPRGVPVSIASGLYLGIGEGIWLNALQHARSTRIRAATGHDPRWSAETSATVLWTMGTLGIVTGGLLGYAREPTPGRISFAASATLWGGVLAGAIGGAIHPYGARRIEDIFLAGGVGYNLGLIAGVIVGPVLSPSVARMRFVDLGGVAGGLVFAGGYALAAGKDSDSRAGLALAAGGAALGLGLSWIATSGMDAAPTNEAPPKATVQPVLTPLQGGAQLGVAGAF